MKSQKREPGKRRKPRLSFGGLTVEEAYRQMFAPAAYKPPPPLAEEERKRLAARIAADAGVREARARIERQLFQPPSEKEVLDIKVRMLLGSLCSKPERPPPPMPKMSQSGKLYHRWLTVVAGRNEGLSWNRAYEYASHLLRNLPPRGTPRTMKEAYQVVEAIRRFVQSAEREAEAKQSGPKNLPR